MVRPEIEFIPFPKIARFARPVIITEKLDGTNAQVYIDPTGVSVHAGSRTRWLTCEEDNYGFARWVEEHQEELRELGPGSHFGEWWGAGIQRRYGLQEKRFSLFNTERWGGNRPACCSVVPVLWKGLLSEVNTGAVLAELKALGSVAAPGFLQPEGIVVFHPASGQLFKRTVEKDESPKGAQ